MEPSRAATRITKILQRTGGSVTSREDRQKIIVQCFERFYVGFWEGVAKARIPANRRRSQSDEDAIQETLLDLDRCLKTGRNVFGSGEDILKWGYRVASLDAIDVFNDNMKEMGPSAVHVPATDGDGFSPAEAIEQIASMRESGEPPADVAAQEAELKESYDGFCIEVDCQIALLDPSERDMVSDWADWFAFRHLAEKYGVPQHIVRRATFDFKETPVLAEEAGLLRMAFGEAEVTWPGLAARIDLRGKGLRLLMDHRDKA